MYSRWTFSRIVRIGGDAVTVIKNCIKAVNRVNSARTKTFDQLNEARFLYPSGITHKLSDVKGSYIDNLRVAYDAIIHVTHCSGPHSYITMVATNYNIVQIMSTLLWNFIDNRDSSAQTSGDRQRANPANNVDLRMLVHESVLESIANENATEVQEIADVNNAKIVLYAVNCPLSIDRVIQIVASPSGCFNCIEELLTLIKSKPKSKLHINRYDPYNHAFYTRNCPRNATNDGAQSTRRTNVVFQPVVHNIN